MVCVVSSQIHAPHSVTLYSLHIFFKGNKIGCRTQSPVWSMWLSVKKQVQRYSSSLMHFVVAYLVCLPKGRGQRTRKLDGRIWSDAVAYLLCWMKLRNQGHWQEASYSDAGHPYLKSARNLNLTCYIMYTLLQFALQTRQDNWFEALSAREDCSDPGML